MKSILYFASVEWGWIKQRPQFLAEELSSYYDITYTTRTNFKREKKGDGKVKLWKLFRLPKESNSLIHLINNWLIRMQLSLKSNKYDMVWFTSPSQYEFAKGLFKDKVIIYDCMDDMVEFHNDAKRRERIIEEEKGLMKRADIVFCSSNYLKEKLIKRNGEREIIVVNNAIKSNLPKTLIQLPQEINEKLPRDKTVITYIGTISEWMNWNLLEETCKKHPEVVFCLFGPLCVEMPICDGIKYCGKVDHQYVFSVMEASDALIMPFIVTELIRSVNPVKLYEYIYSGKPCLAPYYGESSIFANYVQLYHDKDEFINSIEKIVSGKMIIDVERNRDFSKSNTWGERAKEIVNIIEK